MSAGNRMTGALLYLHKDIQSLMICTPHLTFFELNVFHPEVLSKVVFGYYM